MVLRKRYPFLILVAAVATVFFAAADEWDPVDNSTVNATVLYPEKAIQFHGVHDLSSADSNDWFSIDVVAGIPYQFESIGESDTRAYLYADMDETTLLATDDQSGVDDNFSIRYLPSSSTTYYLKVQSFPVGHDVSYTLAYSFYVADEWDPEDNNAVEGTILTMSQNLQTNGTHVLNSYDEGDWFRVHLNSENTYYFYSQGGSDVYVEFYEDPETSYIAEDDDGGSGFNFSLEVTPVITGTYYLKVGDWESESAYDLYYYAQVGGSDGDDDGDSLPDIWEIQYFGGIHALPDGHGDDDFFNNLEEYIAGTDPTNSASFFAVTNYSTGSFVLEWPVVTNREYRVYWTDSLTNRFSQEGDAFYHPVNSYTDLLHTAEDAGFYQVDVRLK